MALLSVMVALPMAWSAQLGPLTRAEALNQVLGTLLIGVLPLLGVMLFWPEDFRGADVDVRYGGDRRTFAVRTFAECALTLTAMGLVFAVGSIVCLRGASDPLLLRDLLATSAVAVPGSLALGAFLGAGRAWLGRVGLLVALALVWAIGPVDALVSAFVPTGHVRSLIGMGAELPLPGWGSLAILWAMAIAFGGVLLARIPR